MRLHAYTNNIYVCAGSKASLHANTLDQLRKQRLDLLVISRSMAENTPAIDHELESARARQVLGLGLCIRVRVMYQVLGLGLCIRYQGQGYVLGVVMNQVLGVVWYQVLLCIRCCLVSGVVMNQLFDVDASDVNICVCIQQSFCCLF